MRSKRLFLPVFLAACFYSKIAIGEECPGWLNANFWEAAIPDETQNCLMAGRSLTERSDIGESPLHLAAAVAIPETVLFLLRSGADVSLTTTDGLTPLHIAARHTTHAAVISYLLVWGSEVNKRIPPDNCWRLTCADTALHLAADRPTGTPILAALLAGGADVSSYDSKGREPLQRAVVSANLAKIEILLNAGARVDGKDSDGNTALHVISKNNINELVIAQKLIAAGADVDAHRDDDVTPLISAAYYTSNPEVFALMLSHSEEPCHASETGTTALTGHDFNPALTKDETYWSLHEQCSQD